MCASCTWNADGLAALRGVRDEEQVPQSRPERVGQSSGPASAGGAVLVQVQLHGGGYNTPAVFVRLFVLISCYLLQYFWYEMNFGFASV